MTTIMKVVPKTNQYTHHTVGTWETINLPSNFGLGQINLLQILSKAIKHDRRLIFCAPPTAKARHHRRWCVHQAGDMQSGRRAHR